MNKTVVLELCDLKKSFKVATTKEIKIFEKIHLSLKSSELVGIIAPSGTGKTSLLNISGLLDQATGGSVRILGQDTKTMTSEKRNLIRRNHIGFVFQSSNLLNEFNVTYNNNKYRIESFDTNITSFNFNDTDKTEFRLLFIT